MHFSFRLFITAITLTSFSFFAVMPAEAKDDAITKIFTQTVQRYGKAPKTQGSGAFIEALMPDATALEKSEARKLLTGMPSEFPTVKMDGERKFVFQLGSDKVLVEFVNNFETHMMKINGHDYNFDPTKKLSFHKEEITKLLSEGKKVSLWNYVIPEAHALETWAKVLLAVAIVVVGATMAYTIGSLKRKNAALRASAAASANSTVTTTVTGTDTGTTTTTATTDTSGVVTGTLTGDGTTAPVNGVSTH